MLHLSVILIHYAVIEKLDMAVGFTAYRLCVNSQNENRTNCSVKK
ncbi:hypothetical protein BH11VER1_BH11VER1_04370 [soil metagenome]